MREIKGRTKAAIGSRVEKREFPSAMIYCSEMFDAKQASTKYLTRMSICGQAKKSHVMTSVPDEVPPPVPHIPLVTHNPIPAGTNNG